MERNFCLLILLCVSVFGSEQFVFWAKFASKNNELIYQEISISPVMTKVKDDNLDFLCELNKEKEKSQNTYEYLLQNQDELIDCFTGMNIKVQDEYLNQKGLGQSTTNIKILPIRFIVEFKGKFAKIYLINTK